MAWGVIGIHTKSLDATTLRERIRSGLVTGAVGTKGGRVVQV
jgi:hypothetical protein